MSNPIPNALALTNIPDGSPRIAAPIRNNYSAVQAAVNALITALKGGAAGALLYATDASDVAYLPDAPNDGDALVWNAAASRWKPTASAGAVTYRKTTAKAVNNTVAETDLLNGEITVGAGVLGTTKVLRLFASGDMLANSGTDQSYPQLKLKLGATTLFDTGASSAGANVVSATRFPWYVEAVVANLGAANSQWATFKYGVGLQSGSGNAAAYASWATGEVATKAAGTRFDATNSAAVDTTAAQALVLSVIEPNASVSKETKLFHALAEIL